MSLQPRIALIATACLMAGCGALRLSVTPEGNIAIAPPNAATGSPGSPATFVDKDQPPPPHVATSVGDHWRPDPIGLLPADRTLRNTSKPVTLQAGAMAVTVRTSDTLVPSWGGDVYLRVDIEAGQATETPPPRDLVVMIDTRMRDALPMARRMAARLFETLRAGDRGGLVVSDTGGRVIVPRLSYGAVPLLMERARGFPVTGADDVSAAVGNAVQIASGSPNDNRIHRVVVFWTEADVVQAETMAWLDAATQSGVEVFIVPLTEGADKVLRPVALRTQAVVLPQVAEPGSSGDEGEVLEELAALPPADAVARDAWLVVDSIPGPFRVIEAAGATPMWGPSSGIVHLGDVRAGDRRTVMLRALVPSWSQGTRYEMITRVRYSDDDGPHEAHTTIPATYTSSPREYASSRAGDVLQYVSLVNTLSNVQAAIARRDGPAMVGLYGPAGQQASAIASWADEHHDAVLGEQANLVIELLSLPEARRLASTEVASQR